MGFHLIIWSSRSRILENPLTDCVVVPEQGTYTECYIHTPRC